MKTCKFCQAEMADDARFCPACGKRWEEETEAAQAEDTPAAACEDAPMGEEAAQASAAPTEAAPAQEPAEAPSDAEAPADAGTPTEEKPAETEIKLGATPGKIALAAAAVVVLLAVLIALIVTGLKDGKETPAVTEPVGESVSTEATETTEPVQTEPPTVPADGNPDDVTCKGTYTVTDDQAIAARDTVVARMGDMELTNGDLQAYYWMEVHTFLMQYYSYASYFGLDAAQPLDTQLTMEQDMTWQQFFLNAALNNWQQIRAMAYEAEQAGLPISQEDQTQLEGLKQTLEDTAKGYELTLEELLARNMGPAATFDHYYAYQRDYCQGMAYYTAQVEKLVPTDRDLEAFFVQHESDYAQQNITKDSLLVDVRHILLQPESAAGDGTHTNEEWAACEKSAQAILDGWKKDGKGESGFAELANEHSVDAGSNTNGGLYENVYPGQMVEEFDAWCFDESRVPGDSGLVKTDFGYHIMYFVGSRPQWKVCAQSDWVNEKINAMLEDVAARHPMEVEYGKIVLGDTVQDD